MSGYFDGLMRASGLPLGNAPVLGAAPRDTTPLTEIDVAVPAATPVIGPLDVTAQAVPQPVANPSSPDVMQPARPAVIATASTTGSAPTRSAAPLPQTGATGGDAMVPSATPTPPGAEPVAEPVVLRERIIEAALRWVADGPTGATTEPPPTPDARQLQPAPRLLPPQPVATFIAAPAPPAAASATVTAQPVVAEPPPRPAVPAIAQPSRAVAMATPMPSTIPPAHDDSVHVSIGAIHLRVEAPPPPPAVQAAPAPVVQRPSAISQTAPRSGLSRRALRRF